MDILNSSLGFIYYLFLMDMVLFNASCPYFFKRHSFFLFNLQLAIFSYPPLVVVSFILCFFC